MARVPAWYNYGKGKGLGLSFQYHMLAMVLHHVGKASAEDLDTVSALVMKFEYIDMAFKVEATILEGKGARRNSPFSHEWIERLLAGKKWYTDRFSPEASKTTTPDELGLNTTFEPVELTADMLEDLCRERTQVYSFLAEATPLRKRQLLKVLDEME